MVVVQKFTLAATPVDGDANGAPVGEVSHPTTADVGDDGGKAPRLPRWTRQEILVLIQGKRVAENRVRRGRTASLAFGSTQVEPKWASVSSYCKRHGVNRGPVQCRKRWSNLAGDFKKIKEWESRIKEDSESFWVMRNDLRREKKLPGFFDREVYDILDGGRGGEEEEGEVEGGQLTLALAPSATLETREVGEDVVEAEAVFDSGRSAAAEDGLFSEDIEQSGHQEEDLASVKEAPTPTIPAPVPISSAKQYQPFAEAGSAPGTSHEKQPASDPKVGSTQEERKRKRTEAVWEDETENLQHQLILALERNGNLLSSQLEAQNSQLLLDREQRNDHANSLIAVLHKVADALGRLADKL